ncbi:hypothetical protein CL3_08940 [butyrate-producing bacterium SM4/1]|nr:hypothetical protein CL3_08940 [butyrate-producing bacterium SM4/1]
MNRRRINRHVNSYKYIIFKSSGFQQERQAPESAFPERTGQKWDGNEAQTA